MFDTYRAHSAKAAFGAAKGGPLIFIVGVVFAAISAGALAAFLPYWIIIAAAAVPIFFVLVAWRIEYGVLAALALVSGIAHEAFLPSLFNLRAGDLAFFAVAAITIVGGYKLSKGFRQSELKLWVPFAIFLLLVPISVVYAYFLQNVPLKDALGEGRHLMYLLFLPLSVAVLNTKERVRRFMRGLVVLGMLFAVGQILQGVFHIRVFGDSGRMDMIQTLAVKSYDATGSKTGGLNIIVFVFFMVASFYISKTVTTFKFLAIAVLSAVGILLTFGRTTWGATLLGLVSVMLLLGLRKSWRLLVWSTVGSTLALATLIALKPTMVDALVIRATSVGKEIEYGSSAAWRYYEVGVIVPKIIASPVVGIGLGAAYRAPAPSDALPEQVRYIHNGYLYLVSKLGVPALLLFIWCLLVVLSWSWRGARHEPDPELRGVHAAICAGMLGILLASVTEPHLMRDSSLAYIGVLAGLSVVMKRYSGMPATAVKATVARALAGSVLAQNLSRPQGA